MPCDNLSFHTGTCSVPFYISQVADSVTECTETCPDNYFGDHTSSECVQCKFNVTATKLAS